MSGICGVLVLDGNEPSMGDLDVMLEKLARRGPDGTNRWLEGPVAIGHTLLATTPEALVEKLPLTDAESGCTITADVRLDNREELLAALDLDGEDRVIGDGELVMRAYLKWGEDCPKHLLGDFAFAIWDPRSQSLFCARDHMGMRQFNYCHLPGKAFVFATEVEAVLEHPAVPPRINETRIADFLMDLEALDVTSTFFEEIYRLPAAHVLRITAEGHSLRRYWQLRSGPTLKLASDQSYSDAFLEVFTQAVRCRLRSPGPVGAMLSGGLDSGSVVAVASRLIAERGNEPLKTFSVVGPDPESCPETRAIHDSVGAHVVDPELINHETLSSLSEDLMKLTKESAEPFDAHMTLVRAVNLAARRQQVKVLLDGAGGDVALNPGAYIPRLLRKGSLLTAVREMTGERRYWGSNWPIVRSLRSLTWRAFAPRSLRLTKLLVEARIQNFRRRSLGIMSRRLADTAAAGELRLRMRRQLLELDTIDHEERAKILCHPYLTAAQERYGRVAASAAVERRDPFMDLRLIEFCSRLPLEQLQAGGVPKAILRRALANVLPEIVVKQVGREHLGWHVTKSLWSQPDSRKYCPAAATIQAYVNLEAVPVPDVERLEDAAFARWLNSVYLGNWLESATVAGLRSDGLE